MKLLKGVDRTDALHLAAVFTVAAVVIAIETVSFQALNFVREYMFATQALSVALMGIAAGGILAYFFDRGGSSMGIQISTTLLPISAVACFPVVLWLTDQPVLMMVLLSIPFVLGSLFISTMFNRLKPSLVYLFDLAGAGVGAFVAVLAIPSLREEGSFFLLGILASIPGVLVWLAQRNKIARIAGIAGTLLLMAGSATLLVIHLDSDPFNMMLNAEADKELTPSKAYHAMNKENPRYILLHSRGSLIERIDILQKTDRKTGEPVEKYNSIYNGRWVDVITKSMSERKGILDFRLPTRLKLGQDPETLLVGPSAQGLTKSVYTLGDGHIDAVEINGAVAGLMTDEMYERSGQAYRPLDLTIGDVRTFLERTDRKYDFITLLNTHRIWSMGFRGPPEYCHTKEAIGSYFEHLTENGFVIFEELNTNPLADMGIRRFIHTVKTALKEKGVERPQDHLAVWEHWGRCKRRAWNRDKCPQGSHMTFLAIKKTPIDQAEYEHLQDWAKMIHDRSVKNKGPFYSGIKWRYFPQAPTKHYFSKVVLADDIYGTPGIDPAIHDMAPATDDRPFPFDVFKERTVQTEMLKNVGLVCLVLVLIPSIIAFSRRRKDASSPKGSLARATLLVLYFAVLGIAYLFIEIVLIQRLQIFLSSPTVSLVVVLGTMLISSGIGGYLSGRLKTRGIAVSMLVIVALTAASYFFYSNALGLLMPLPFAARVAFAVLMVAVIGFFMGVPFPVGLRLTKSSLTERHACLYFGINGALGALATPLSILLSSLAGFDLTFMAGGAAYLVSLLILLAALRAGGDRAIEAE